MSIAAKRKIIEWMKENKKKKKEKETSGHWPDTNSINQTREIR